MISKKSIEPLIWCFKILSWTRLNPFYWDSTNQTLIMWIKHDNLRSNRVAYWIWRIVGLSNLILQMCYVTIVCYILSIQSEVNPIEIMIAIFFVSTVVLSLPQHCFAYVLSSEFYVYFRTMIQFNRDSGE